uniref:Uncharacterized protein n=1 Tax=Megaviridae environmental sample TaxID=1737588 RepID=A0A5J6VIU1_9VIRU|nr:MAG: hypothetical protein [Megaviridae environmental sample]
MNKYILSKLFYYIYITGVFAIIIRFIHQHLYIKTTTVRVVPYKSFYHIVKPIADNNEIMKYIIIQDKPKFTNIVSNTIINIKVVGYIEKLNSIVFEKSSLLFHYENDKRVYHKYNITSHQIQITDIKQPIISKKIQMDLEY